MCIPVALSPLGGQPYLTYPAAAIKSQLHVGKTGIACMHTVHKLWVSSINFQLLTETNGPTKADDSKIIMVNPYVASGCTNRS